MFKGLKTVAGLCELKLEIMTGIRAEILCVFKTKEIDCQINWVKVKTIMEIKCKFKMISSGEYNS